MKENFCYMFYLMFINLKIEMFCLWFIVFEKILININFFKIFNNWNGSKDVK